MIVVLVDEDEVGVDFKATVFTKHNANLVPIARVVIKFADGTILEQRRNGQLGLID